MRIATFWILTALLTVPTFATVETERLYLSGTGIDDAVDWEFFCTGGRRSGVWTTIPVPSQWELHGFGRYNYGHDDRKSDEQGRYRHRFRVPAGWQGRRVELVFEGVMTDAEVTVNGHPAGPVHQGAFYRFRFDVGKLLRFGEENLLEVTVRKQSADASVNRAERDADYWVFGGIFRPVYLEGSPQDGIAGIAIDAGHDGRLALAVSLHGQDAGADGELAVRVETLAGEPVGEPLTAGIPAGAGEVRLEGRFDGVRPWSAETPRLYRARVELVRGGALVHRVDERFGFRTIEVRAATGRPGAGVFVNGRRVLLKGVDRHAFWPTSGRTLGPRLDRRDAELLKAMHLNAVRSSHYPPDEPFLAACDELGLYVVDELAGWHDAYATEVGRRRVEEMVTRDRNHPSILFWANGNEGGWNERLDGEFHRWDLQRRPVLHPDALAGGLDTLHYPTWDELATALDPKSWRNLWRRLRLGSVAPVMPTEILHGLYDGGSGAGLEDTWRAIRSSPLGAGLFLWSFSDESVVRTDRGGVLDSDGNHAPDGILGPYRERTGNFYAVRELFAPIVLAEPADAVFRGRLTLENRFDMTDLEDCRFHWSLLDLPGPGEATTPAVLASGEVAGPRAAPGETGELALELGGPPADALRLTARDPDGREAGTWVLPVRDLRADVRALGQVPGEPPSAEERDDRIVLAGGGTIVEIDRRSGELRALLAGGERLPLAGPRPAHREPAPPAAVRQLSEDGAQIVETVSDGDLESIRWALHPSGWLNLDFRYSADGPLSFHGVHLPFPGADVRRLRWLGRGPARVWRNRLAGGTLGVWSKGPSTPVESPAEPKLEGFYAGVVWAELDLPGGRLLLAFESDDLYLGIGSPAFPADARHAVAAPTPEGIGFYKTIPAIGTKFHPAAELGPQSRPAVASGSYRGVVWMRFVTDGD